MPPKECSSTFRTQGGVVKGEKGAITVPVTLWIKAVDLLFDQMKLDGVDFSVIKALSGAAQVFICKWSSCFSV